MRVHKRKKNSRLRGSRTAGWGFRQKHKGHGNKGGVGHAGSGKKADHKKQVHRESDKKQRYFGKQGATSRGSKRVKQNKINLASVKENFFKKEGATINLEKYIILGVGDGFKATINAKSASKAAIEKMKQAGGAIVLPKEKTPVKQYKKQDKKESVSPKNNSSEE